MMTESSTEARAPFTESVDVPIEDGKQVDQYPNDQQPPNYQTTSESRKNIKVLIVGESQQGKSTLIRFLGHYTKLDINIEIGGGNKACTRQVGEYQFDISLRSFKLEDLNGHTIGTKDFEALCDLRRDDAQVIVDKEEECAVTFTFIDTPGLDDSEGRDMDIMTDIITSMSAIKGINAVVYVRNIQKPLGKSFKVFFEYLQRSMPAISNGLVVVHSHCTTGLVLQSMAQKTELYALRIAAFKRATGQDLMHFFMDNIPSKYSPFAICESFNACHKLLLHVRSQDPIDMKNVKLIKTPAMCNMDVHVISTLNELRARLDKSFNSEKSHLDQLERNVLDAARESERLKSKIAVVEGKIHDRMNGTDIVLGTKSVVEAYSFLDNLLLSQEVKLGKQFVTYDSDCIIDHVNTSVSGGSRWLSQELRGTSWKAVLTASWFRDLNGTATFYAKSKEKYRGELEVMRDRLAEFQQSLSYLDGVMSNNKRNTVDSELVKLGEQSGRSEELVKTIEAELLDTSLYPLLKFFYNIEGKPSRSAVRDFIKVYDDDLSRLV